MRCPICNGKHECPDPDYLKVAEFVQLLKRLGVVLYFDSVGLRVSLPIEGRLTKIAEQIEYQKRDIEWFFSIEQAIVAPRLGIARVLRNLRDSGDINTAQQARALSKRVIATPIYSSTLGDLLEREHRACRVVVCRWMKYRHNQKNKVSDGRFRTVVSPPTTNQNDLESAPRGSQTTHPDYQPQKASGPRTNRGSGGAVAERLRSA